MLIPMASTASEDVPFQGLAESIGNAGHGDVIAGGAQASGSEHHFVMGCGCPHLRTDCRHLISHNRHLLKQA